MICWVDAPERNATWQVSASSSVTCITASTYSCLLPASSVAGEAEFALQQQQCM
jgi:hypothetical protein